MIMDQQTKESLRKMVLDYREYAPQFHKIVNKHGEIVLFRLNSIQLAIDEKINELQTQGKPVRLIILKPRQPGVSTYTESKILHKCCTQENRTGLVVAHTDVSTNSVFNKTKFMYDNLPDKIKPMKKASNAQELIFDTPSTDKSGHKGLNSRVKIATAGGKSIGRGDTYNYVHLSEFAFFPGDIRSIFIGIMQAVPKTSDTMVIIESTANGFNEYKEVWDKAISGQNEFTALFFAWHDHEEYQMPVTDEERHQITSSVSDYEKDLVRLYGCTAEQIKWYRWTLANDCAGDHNLMKQENPSNPDEAFLMTGTPVFDLEKVAARKAELEKLYTVNKPMRGNLRDNGDTVSFVPDINGFVTIYEQPKANHPYTIGADVAEGTAKGDFDAAQVLDNVTMNQVAVFHGKMDVDLYAEELHKLGRYYNNALLAVETNFNPGTVLNLERMTYPKQYVRQQIDTFTKTVQNKLGWHTDRISRPVIISDLVELVREHIHLLNDLATLNEMMTFIRNDQGRPEGQTGKHDDLVMALAIAIKAGEQQSKRSTSPVEGQKRLSDLPEDMRQDYYSASAEQKKYLQKKWNLVV